MDKPNEKCDRDNTIMEWQGVHQGALYQSNKYKCLTCGQEYLIPIRYKQVNKPINCSCECHTTSDYGLHSDALGVCCRRAGEIMKPISEVETVKEKPSPILYMPKLYRLLMKLQHAGHIDEAHIKMISSDIEVYIDKIREEMVEDLKAIMDKFHLVDHEDINSTTIGIDQVEESRAINELINKYSPKETTKEKGEI